MAGTPRPRPTTNRPTRRKPANPPPPEVPYELPQCAQDFGLRIEQLTLLGEDAAALRVELNRWYAFYRARSPIALACVGWAFLAWVRLGRLRDCEAAIQKGAIRKGEEQWDDAQDELIERYQQLLGAAPAEAIRGLEGFAAGNRWLINRWQRLKGLLQKDGYWCDRDRDEAIRLLGAEPALDRLRESRAGYLTWLYALLCQPKPDDADVRLLSAPGRIPPALRESMDFTRLPNPAGCREWLRKLIDQILALLRQREEALWLKVEEPGRSQAIAHELAEAEQVLKNAAWQKRHWETSLKRNLKMAAQECKLAGIAVPKGVPYEPEPETGTI
jgi:hypothetical protein